jgi:hypothetical protein
MLCRFWACCNGNLLSKPKKRLLLLHDRTPSVLRQHQDVSGAPPDRYILKEQNDNLGTKRSGRTFVLPTITSICTYNVGVWRSLYMRTHRFWLWELISNPLISFLSSTKHMWFGPSYTPNVAHNACPTHVSWACYAQYCTIFVILSHYCGVFFSFLFFFPSLIMFVSS